MTIRMGADSRSCRVIGLSLIVGSVTCQARSLQFVRQSQLRGESRGPERMAAGLGGASRQMVVPSMQNYFVLPAPFRFPLRRTRLIGRVPTLCPTTHGLARFMTSLGSPADPAAFDGKRVTRFPPRRPCVPRES